jgi:LPS sulfotransferase NodH
MARLERRSEAMFRALGVRPLRLSYERTIGEEPERLARRIGAHLGVPWDAGARFESVHSKLGTDKNLRFAERFRAENPRLLARIERARAPRLAALDG